MKHVALGLVLLVAGCGKADPPVPPPSPSTSPPPSAPPPPPAETTKKPTTPDKQDRAAEKAEEARRKKEAERKRDLEQLDTMPEGPAKRRLEEKLGFTARPLVPRPPAPPEPQMYLTVNGSDVPRVPAGWPMVIELTVHAPAGGALKLEAPSGNWGDLVRVEFPEGWNPKPLVQASGALSLDDTTSARLAWTVSPEESSARPPGVVEVRATLGKMRCGAQVTVLAAARRDSMEGVPVMVRYLLAMKDADGALKEVDAMLKRQVAHPALLMLRADVLVQLGRKEEALQALDEGIRSAIKYKMATRGLLARRRMIEESK